MIRKVAEYEVRAGEESTAEDAIHEFVAAVRREERGTSYDAFRRGDGGFIHFMAFTDEAAEQRHRAAAYTTRFVERLYPICVEPPRFTELRAVG